MLFDLRGRRRRAVQVTYLLLAVLMGGGLLLFGIGGGVSGGLLDAITGKNGGGGGNDQLQKRVDHNEKVLARHPGDIPVLKALVRDNYALAVSTRPSGTTAFPDDAKDDLRAAGRAWQQYLGAEKGTPDATLAGYALQIYDTGALNQAKDAARAMAIIAEARNDYQSYLALVQRASAAGDSRTADLAAQKAVDLAPKSLKKQVKQATAEAKKTSTTPSQQ